MWEVTKADSEEIHPLRLFQGIIRKYDALLLGDKKQFKEQMDYEKIYCGNFFAEYNFMEEQLQAILDYKDAYAMKEMVAKLLYDPDYMMHGFLLTEMSKEAKIKE